MSAHAVDDLLDTGMIQSCGLLLRAFVAFSHLLLQMPPLLGFPTVRNSLGCNLQASVSVDVPRASHQNLFLSDDKRVKQREIWICRSDGYGRLWQCQYRLGYDCCRSADNIIEPGFESTGSSSMRYPHIFSTWRRVNVIGPCKLDSVGKLASRH